ncbi:Diadenosine tetraphosphate (Ap4A) hydrolase [Lentzea jiangxiensis]|uniref:Diadenosine tetraphosphate (Ap4A) hydrolase n=2 Tax=Lentzea jiangxiensis TaxID=641025 RepID=A0A1H0NTP8_9PSEU|nr:Diadenosine tetraphosphate (Ap4A) hydrolase [Lentzea jiangxiensis]
MTVTEREKRGVMRQSVEANRDQGRPRAQADCLFCNLDDSSLNDIMTYSENFVVRRDNFPSSRGHVEVVPRRHVESFFDLTAAEVAEAFELMQEARKKIDDAFGPAAYTIGVNDGTAAGRTIDHLHIHLIPRYEGDVEDPRGGIRQILPGVHHPDDWAPRS